MSVKQANLAEVISEVLENLSMMIAEMPDTLENFEPQLEGLMDFTGPVTGSIAVRCTERFAQNLAANLLGIQGEDLQTQAKAWDALAEMLNVVCGNVVTVMFDPNKSFTLSTPQINVMVRENPSDAATCFKAPSGQAPCRNEQKANILLDGQPMEFVLRVY